MNQHHVETCSDDTAKLTERLDRLTEEGWQILTVFWQASGSREDDQPAAMAAGGSFVIICQRQMEPILRSRDDVTDTPTAVRIEASTI